MESLGRSPRALPSGGLVFQLVCHFHRYWASSSKSTVGPKMESCFQDGACSVHFLLHFQFTQDWVWTPHCGLYSEESSGVASLHPYWSPSSSSSPTFPQKITALASPPPLGPGLKVCLLGEATPDHPAILRIPPLHHSSSRACEYPS